MVWVGGEVAHFSTNLRHILVEQMAAGDPAGQLFWRENFASAISVPLPAFAAAWLRAQPTLGLRAEKLNTILRVVLAPDGTVKLGEWNLFLHRFGPFKECIAKAMRSCFMSPAFETVQPWFHGKIGRQTAIDLLQSTGAHAGEPGHFLVRFSEQNPEQFTVVFLKQGTSSVEVKNCLLYNRGVAGYSLNPDGEVYSDLSDFVVRNTAKLKYSCESDMFRSSKPETAYDVFDGENPEEVEPMPTSPPVMAAPAASMMSPPRPMVMPVQTPPSGAYSTPMSGDYACFPGLVASMSAAPAHTPPSATTPGLYGQVQWAGAAAAVTSPPMVPRYPQPAATPVLAPTPAPSPFPSVRAASTPAASEYASIDISGLQGPMLAGARPHLVHAASAHPASSNSGGDGKYMGGAPLTAGPSLPYQRGAVPPVVPMHVAVDSTYAAVDTTAWNVGEPRTMATTHASPPGGSNSGSNSTMTSPPAALAVRALPPADVRAAELATSRNIDPRRYGIVAGEAASPDNKGSTQGYSNPTEGTIDARPLGAAGYVYVQPGATDMKGGGAAAPSALPTMTPQEVDSCVEAATQAIARSGFDDARRLLLQAIDAAQARKLPDREAKARSNLGFVLFKSRNFTAAIQQYEAALPLWEYLGDSNSVAKVLNAVTVCCMDAGMYRAALQHALRHRKLRESSPADFDALNRRVEELERKLKAGDGR